MSRTVAIISALAAGGLVGLQPPANAAMAQHVGQLGATFVSLAISICVAAALLLVFGHPARLSGIAHFRPEWALGGLGGVVVVTVGLVAVRPLGAAVVIALLVASQLVISIVSDQLGWFGSHHAISAGRIAGALLVTLGTLLITRF